MKTPKNCDFTKALRNLHAFFVTVRRIFATDSVLGITRVLDLVMVKWGVIRLFGLVFAEILRKFCTKLGKTLVAKITKFVHSLIFLPCRGAFVPPE